MPTQSDYCKNKPTPNLIDAMRNWLNCNFFGPILLKSEKNCTRREKLVLFFCSAENLILDSPLNINFSTVHLAIKLNISLLRNWDSNTLTWHRIMDNFKRESFPTGRIVSIPAATPYWCWDYGFTNFSTTALLLLPTKSPFDHKQQILYKKILLKESDK